MAFRAASMSGMIRTSTGPRLRGLRGLGGRPPCGRSFIVGPFGGRFATGPGYLCFGFAVFRLTNFRFTGFRVAGFRRAVFFLRFGGS